MSLTEDRQRFLDALATHHPASLGALAREPLDRARAIRDADTSNDPVELMMLFRWDEICARADA